MDKSEGLDRLRILIADANPHMMSIVKLMLRGYGVRQYGEAATCDAAWDELDAGVYDLMICERMLGEQDTLSLVRRIRTDPDSGNPYLPIVMLSAYSEQVRIEEARDAGVTEFCRKPVTARDLFAKIAISIDRPRRFVRANTYFGPDRRRRDGDQYDGVDRRARVS